MREDVRDGTRQNERKADRRVNSGRFGGRDIPAEMPPVEWLASGSTLIWAAGVRFSRLGRAARTLILPCSGNILKLRSEAGRTMEWAQAHFFVGPVAVL